MNTYFPVTTYNEEALRAISQQKNNKGIYTPQALRAQKILWERLHDWGKSCDDEAIINIIG